MTAFFNCHEKAQERVQNKGQFILTRSTDEKLNEWIPLFDSHLHGAQSTEHAAWSTQHAARMKIPE